MRNVIILVISGLLCVNCSQTNHNFLESKEAYFGLERPGSIPLLFAPGIVSDTSWREHSQIAISPDGREIYWSRFATNITEQIYFSKFEDDTWTKPAVVGFLKDDLSSLNGGPTFSLDGQKMFFYSRDRQGGSGYIDAWYVKREGDTWGRPINAGEPYNSSKDDRPPIFTQSGKAYNMRSDINSELTERFPIVSPDGKYLFFMRQTETWDIFWVSSDIINNLRSESYQKENLL